MNTNLIYPDESYLIRVPLALTGIPYDAQRSIRFADVLRREVAATVATEAGVEEELRYLLTVLSHE